MLLSRVAVLCVVFLVFASAHDILYKYRLKCGPEGPPTQIEWMLFNDFGPRANLTANGVSGGNVPVPGNTVTFGPTVGCTSQTCTTWEKNLPSWDYTGTYRSSFIIFQQPLVAIASYQTCKNAGNTNCGNPFQTIPAIKGDAYWPQDNHWIRGWTSASVPITESVVAGAGCPTDRFDCPAPVTDQCSVASCRCNSFTFTAIKTVSGQTTISVNVTNNCQDPFYYAAFGLDGGLVLQSPAVGSQKRFVNYDWTVQSVDGSGGSTTPPIKWVRFQTTAGANGNAQFTNKSGPSWEVFTFVVSNYQPNHAWTVQGHEGAKWDTFRNIDVSLCPCPNCDSTTSSCPAKPGYTGPNCTDCDRSPPPGGYSWFCIDNQNPSNPWRLVKILTSQIGTAPYTIPPGFEPSNADGSIVTDKDGYLINCDCSRTIHTCEPLSYCNGHGSCVPQTGVCECDQGFLGPDCRPPTTTPAVTTTPAGTTTTPAPTTTQVGDTTPPPTTTVEPTTPAPTTPPCYNGGKFCTGHGSCNGNTCQCDSGYQGAACDEVVVTNPTHYCDEFSTCDTCASGAAAVGLQCSWCRDVPGGGCIASASCTNVYTSCGATGISFVPEPCPDDCSGTHGSCVNTTCSEYARRGEKPPVINKVVACINDSDAAQFDEEFNTTVIVDQEFKSYCLCKKGYSGANCGGKSNNLGKALAISGGVIAAIVICGVIILVLFAFGAKKGVDFVMLQQQAAADFKNNPTHENRDQEHFSAIHN